MADSTVALHLENYASTVDAGALDQEHALVEALRSGEGYAYETLIQRYEQPVYSIVSRVLDTPEDAADVTQEVFLKVFRKIDAFRGESTLKTWIYRIAVNEAHNQRRWFGRHRGQEIALEPEQGRQGICDVMPDRGPSPYEIARDHETHQLIENALQGVSGQYRAALVLREVEGLRYEEIAEILEVSLGTVKSRILRGREALRKVLLEKLQRTSALPTSSQPTSTASLFPSRVPAVGAQGTYACAPLEPEVARSVARAQHKTSTKKNQWYD